MATSAAAPGAGEPRRWLKIWDAPTRILHGLLVLLLPALWWTATRHHLVLHRVCGYTVLGLLLFRLLWGFAGSRTARFAHFVRGPRATLAYLKTLPSRRALVVPGHNPLGALSVVAMLLLLCAQVGLGLFSVDTDGIESGPLSSYVSFEFGRACARLHHLGFNLLLVLVGLHVAAIAFYLVWKRENLIGPMIVGGRRLPAAEADAHGADLRFAPLWRLVLAACAAGLGAWIVSRGLRLG